MEQKRFRRIRNRVQPGLPQDGPGETGAIHIKKGPDLPGVAQGMRAVADHLQAPGGKGGNRRNMG